jgi:hypothetical protein
MASDPFRGGVRVIITGPQGFERAVLVCLGRRSRGHHPTGQADDRRVTAEILLIFDADFPTLSSNAHERNNIS